jgi:hypothetical protein
LPDAKKIDLGSATGTEIESASERYRDSSAYCLGDGVRAATAFFNCIPPLEHAHDHFKPSTKS